MSSSNTPKVKKKGDGFWMSFRIQDRTMGLRYYWTEPEFFKSPEDMAARMIELCQIKENLKYRKADVLSVKRWDAENAERRLADLEALKQVNE